MPGSDLPVRYQVTHRTAYEYSSSVSDAYTVAHLLPRNAVNQIVIDAEIDAEPAADEFDTWDDAFGNRVAQMGVHGAHDRFTVTSRCTVDVSPPALPAASAAWESVAEMSRAVRGDAVFEIGSSLAITPALVLAESGGDLDAMFEPAFGPGRPLVDVARDVCSMIHGTFAFDPTATDVSTPLDEVVGSRRGVCQDFAHLALAVFRRRGLAARYVSGYIETDPPPGEAPLVGADASHAWCALWIPGHGWLDLDPTNDHFPPTRHVTVAWGRDYRDVAPVRGVVIGPSTTQTLDVAVDVRRI